MTPITVVLADDHPLLRAGVRAQLERMPGIAVVGEASDSEEAMAQVAKHRPNVVLMDISMPGIGGIDTLAVIHLRFPGTRVVMLTMHDGEEYVVSAMRSGAAGYVLKDARPAELQLALETVSAGNTFISPSVAKALAHYLQRSDSDAPPPVLLTPRQREVLRLIAESRHTKEIAAILKISIKTVEMHRARIMTRLDIHNVAGLVRYAVRSGVVPTDR
jgi:DNA-binding NarL/FixJ family response regulator